MLSVVSSVAIACLALRSATCHVAVEGFSAGRAAAERAAEMAAAFSPTIVRSDAR